MIDLKMIVEKGNKAIGGGLTFGETVPDAHIACSAEKIKEFVQWLKTKDGGDFVSLMCVSGVDYKEYLECVYHLFSFSGKQMLPIKVKLADRNHPHVPSLCEIHKAANFWERETFDLMGIIFDGHPDLRRILCPEDWEGFPLRKDYKAQEFYQGIPMGMESPKVEA